MSSKEANRTIRALRAFFAQEQAEEEEADRKLRAEITARLRYHTKELRPYRPEKESDDD